MFNNSWKFKGIVLTAPQPYKNEIEDVVKFIDKILAPAGVNLIVLQIRYKYQFKRHPECWGYDPLSSSDVKALLNVCRKNSIKLIPKMNLAGHQSGVHRASLDGILHGLAPGQKGDFPDALLRAYPFFEEKQPEDTFLYSRHLCLTNPLLPSIIFELMDELLDVFEADTIHIGCDECWGIGTCPECSQYDKGTLLANYINMINAHLKSRNVQAMIWSDRLVDAIESGYEDIYESSYDDADKALKLIDKDVICCDWHYNACDAYKSVDIFADSGFKMMVVPWNNVEAAGKFLDYAVKHDKGHILGYLQSTWCSSGELARYYLYGEKPYWENTSKLIEVMDKYIL